MATPINTQHHILFPAQKKLDSPECTGVAIVNVNALITNVQLWLFEGGIKRKRWFPMGLRSQSNIEKYQVSFSPLHAVRSVSCVKALAIRTPAVADWAAWWAERLPRKPGDLGVRVSLQETGVCPPPT